MKILNGIRFFILFGIIVGLVVLPSSTMISRDFLYQTVFAQQQTSHLHQQHPNILLIVGDDFGYSDIGSFGSVISTPNLDALTKEGKILTNYHTIPVCSPARVSLLTGVDHHIGGIGTMYELIAPNQVGMPGYETWINNKVVTVAELLKESGYHTYLSGKWHLSGNHEENGSLPSDRGFEKSLTLLNGAANHFNGYPEAPIEKITFAEDGKIIPRPGNKTLYSNDLYTNKMMEYIKSNINDRKPFFGYLAFQVAHSPFQAPEGTISKYDKIYSIGWDEIRKQAFEKQKELGFWPANMKLPERIPPTQPWSQLTTEQKSYASRILAAHAAMIENMDRDIGKVIKLLKDTGQYDNTLIIFISDNGSSEPSPLLSIKFSTRDAAAMINYIEHVNNTLSNIGNGSSIVNYAAWGSFSTAVPLSGFKATEYEAGTRVPFVVKEPIGIPSSQQITKSPNTPSSVASTAATSTVGTENPKMIKAFAYVNDVTPTILDYAGIKHPGTTYKGMQVHPIMGKSLKSLFNGTSNKVYGENEIVADEMFNNTAVYMGDWKAMKHQRPLTDGKWQLYNIVNDPGENVNVANQHPDILQKMIAGYEVYSKDVGVVIPRGEQFADGLASTIPPLNNHTQTTITSQDIEPAQFAHESPIFD